jgi:hypothetical protein
MPNGVRGRVRMTHGVRTNMSISTYASQMLFNETHRGVNVPRSAWLTQTIDRIGGASDVASSVVAVAVVECTDAMQVHVPPPDRPVPASLVWRSCWGLAGAGGYPAHHGIMSAEVISFLIVQSARFLWISRPCSREVYPEKHRGARREINNRKGCSTRILGKTKSHSSGFHQKGEVVSKTYMPLIPAGH